MWPNSKLIDLIGVEHPIIQAPMAGSGTPAMAAAAANAGCVGSLGCAMMTKETYQQNFDQTRRQTNGALNMNFFCHDDPVSSDEKNRTAIERLTRFYEEEELASLPNPEPTHFPFDSEMADAVLASNPAIISFHFGLPTQEIVRQFRDNGTIILSSATTVAEAKYLEENGAHAIIAQGWEAGGHHGYFLTKSSARMGTMALVPQIVDAVDVPVIAAGGISDGRGIAAAFALGAAGVQIGTAFLTCEESGVPNAHRRELLNSDGSNTNVTKAFSGRPARGVQNKYMTEMEGIEDELPDFPIMNTLTGPLRKKSASEDRPDFVALWSGQAVGLNRVATVADLIDRLKAETFEVMKTLK